jgi:hypothetical protein
MPAQRGGLEPSASLARTQIAPELAGNPVERSW